MNKVKCPYFDIVHTCKEYLPTLSNGKLDKRKTTCGAKDCKRKARLLSGMNYWLKTNGESVMLNEMIRLNTVCNICKKKTIKDIKANICNSKECFNKASNIRTREFRANDLRNWFFEELVKPETKCIECEKPVSKVWRQTCSIECSNKAKDRKYKNSVKGKQKIKERTQCPEEKERKRAWKKTEAGKLSSKKYKQSEKGKASARASKKRNPTNNKYLKHLPYHLEAQDNKCKVCGDSFKNTTPTIHHNTPQSVCRKKRWTKNQTHCRLNTCATCKFCNSEIHDKNPEQYVIWLIEKIKYSTYPKKKERLYIKLQNAIKFRDEYKANYGLIFLMEVA